MAGSPQAVRVRLSYTSATQTHTQYNAIQFNAKMTPLIFLLIAITMSLTPWQLFQQMCPLVSPNSPQCFRTQQQQPFNNFSQQQLQPIQ
jgi:hypothetical protein